ncbi:D-alanyl-D-alanine carboxypeptidase/D-alanyl-D-alanine-endopeptidase [Oceanobacillus massiliensis]|uniref:D-alanyl-D-alanine carboxypeptidase/D-alanyl-D-alanine endopeptidase n=1 Tax=Oceanobacillus massiliensis TaxID=1465765 RepID=UPI00028A262C|nr:D-alanyl-D-alanine carboxypeptidase/D-alanyl-D-alanine-endopeptidase [Oceanobacillus massiliensis]
MLVENITNYVESDKKIKGGLIGISIRKASSGDAVYEHQGDIRLHPASNMKLLTAAAALNVLGAEYRFNTEIRSDGTIGENMLEGNLYIIGKGDPTLLEKDFDAFAEKMKAMGIRTINGDIIGDDTWYDDVRISPDLVWKDEQYYYGAQVSALTASPNEDYDTGSVMIEVAPGEAGENPAFTISPATNYITIYNEAVTVSETVEDELIIERDHGGNFITIKGRISHHAEPIKEWMAVWGVSEYAMDLFGQSLKKHGITWNGSVKLGPAPASAGLLLSRSSIRLSELLVPFMKLSNNGIAEILVKEMGKKIHNEGSWESGLDVLGKEMDALGMEMASIKLKDGSGISHSNLIPPSEISKLLYEIQNKEWFPVYLASLPIAGEEDRMIGGTLRERMKGFSVKAKTGTIEGVSTLSGYMNKSDGEKLIISIMINNLLDEDEGKVIEDEIIGILGKEY